MSWNELFQRVAAQIRRLETNNNTTLGFSALLVSSRNSRGPGSGTPSSKLDDVLETGTDPSRGQGDDTPVGIGRGHKLGSARANSVSSQSTRRGQPRDDGSVSPPHSAASTAGPYEAGADGGGSKRKHAPDTGAKSASELEAEFAWEYTEEAMEDKASPFTTLAALARDFVQV